MTRARQFTKSLISLLIFLHLVMVVIGVFRHQVSSRLFQNVANTVSIYSQTFGIDPGSELDFRLTHATSFEDNHHFEVYLPEQDEPIFLPDAQGVRTGEKGGFRYNRFRRFTDLAAFAVSIDDDSTLALYAKCIGNRFLDNETVDRFVLRLAGFNPPNWRSSNQIVWRDLGSSVYFENLYEADVWRGEDGKIHVHKRVPTGEAAPLTHVPITTTE